MRTDGVMFICFVMVLGPGPSRQESAEVGPFHGFLPAEKLRALSPAGDDHPNDIYYELRPDPDPIPDGFEIRYPNYRFTFEVPKDPEELQYIIVERGSDANEHNHQHPDCAHHHSHPTPAATAATSLSTRQQTVVPGFTDRGQSSALPTEMTRLTTVQGNMLDGTVMPTAGGFSSITQRDRQVGDRFSMFRDGPGPTVGSTLTTFSRTVPTMADLSPARPTVKSLNQAASFLGSGTRQRPVTRAFNKRRPARVGVVQSRMGMSAFSRPRSAVDNQPRPTVGNLNQSKTTNFVKPTGGTFVRRGPGQAASPPLVLRRPPGVPFFPRPPPSGKSEQKRGRLPGAPPLRAPSLEQSDNPSLGGYPPEQYRHFPGGYVRLSTFSSVSG